MLHVLFFQSNRLERLEKKFNKKYFFPNEEVAYQKKKNFTCYFFEHKSSKVFKTFFKNFEFKNELKNC